MSTFEANETYMKIEDTNHM